MSDFEEEIDIDVDDFLLEVDTTSGEVRRTESREPDANLARSIRGSASLIKAYQQCPAQAYGKITRQKQTKTLALVNGIAVHIGLESYAKEEDKDPQVVYINALKHEAEKGEVSLTGDAAAKAKVVGQECVGAGVAILDSSRNSDLPLKKRINKNDIEVGFTFTRNGFLYVGKMDFLVFKQPLEAVKYSVCDWKGLALDTPLPTPTGWTTMGEVKEGDELFDRYGHVCQVVGKSQIHHKKCFRVTFDDKSSIVCDYDHRWLVQTDCGEKILHTDEIRDSLINPSTGQRDNRIHNTWPLNLPEAELEASPYVLGVWLGDGKARDDSITVASSETEIVDRIATCGYRTGKPFDQAESCAQVTIHGLRKQLVKLGVLNNKHIPQQYLRASLSQRVELLQGLMDTDGTWNKVRNQAVFTSKSETLAAQVQELVLSLGAKCTKFKLKKRGFGKEATCYDVVFTPVDFNPFTLPRKAEQVRIAKYKSRRRMILSVEEVPTVPTQCIAVDSDDHTYLCGEQMVPTHNTGKNPPKGKAVGAYYELDNDIQFTLYAEGSAKDEKLALRTFGKYPQWNVYLHLRGASQEYDEKTGRRVDKRRTKKPLQYEWPTKRTEEDIEKAFVTVIEPEMQNMTDGRWSRRPGRNCENCGFFNKQKLRCEVEIPQDAQLKKQPQMSLIDGNSLTASKAARLKPYSDA